MEVSRISTMSVTGLFGYLNQEIQMDESGITFIHGPNGCGKTTILNILSSIFSVEVYRLKEIIFKLTTIKFTDGSVLCVRKTLSKVQMSSVRYLIQDNEIPELHNTTITFSYTDSKSIKHDDYKVKFPANGLLMSRHRYIAEITRQLPFLRQVGPRRWRDRRTDDIYSYEELVRKYSHLFFNASEIPQWFVLLCKNNKIQYIKTQRLLAIGNEENDDRRISETIQVYSSELKNMISEKLAEQAAASQMFDSTFPERLLKGEIHFEDEATIRERYGKIEVQTKELVEAGLINKQKHIPLPEKKLRDDQLNVMTLYLDDMEKKLTVFYELQQKIKTFLEIVGTKLQGKILSVNRNSGFLITAKTSKTGKKIINLSPTQLSSGEQHQIVLFYELIFKAERCSFFLIDEPEISLHVDWQRQFVKDIMQVKDIGNSSFLIATHSPQIISTHYEKARALNGGILVEAR